MFLGDVDSSLRSGIREDFDDAEMKALHRNDHAFLYGQRNL